MASVLTAIFAKKIERTVGTDSGINEPTQESTNPVGTVAVICTFSFDIKLCSTSVGGE